MLRPSPTALPALALLPALAVLMAACVLPAVAFAAGEAASTSAVVPAAVPTADPAVAIVTGLAADDVLNIRSTASAVGKIEARVPNGSALNNYGCGDFNGYRWCKVEIVGKPDLSGWTPARYLTPVDADQPVPDINAKDGDAAPDTAPAPASARTEPAPGAPETARAAATDGKVPAAGEPGPAPADAPATGAIAPDKTARRLPANLDARMGGDSPASAGENEREFTEAMGKTPAEAAQGLGFAAGGNVVAAGDARPPPDEAKTLGPAAEAPAGIPVPTPRPDGLGHLPAAQALAGTPVRKTYPAPAIEKADSRMVVAEAAITPAARPLGAGADEPSPDADAATAASTPPAAPTQTAAIAPAVTLAPATPVSPPPASAASPAPVSPVSLAPAASASGDIPCARYLGQPMTRCQASVVRTGPDKADVTVTWPDGGGRTISFYAGAPAGADSRGEFRFTREGGLNMIRVGASERFEITDALAFGG